MDIEYLRRNSIRICIGIVVCVFFMLSEGMGWTQPVYTAGNYVMEPVVYWTNEFGIGVERTVGTIVEIGSLRSENARLNLEIAELLAQCGNLSEVEKENDILRTQLGIEVTKDWQLVRVRVLGLDERGVADYVIIDKGWDKDIAVGNVVIYGDILVGVVREVFQSSARVRLISNQGSNIAVVDQRTRAKGLVRGSLEGIVMEEVLENEEIAVGDVIMTWENDIPEGLVVGVIRAVDETHTLPTKRAFIDQGFSLEDLQYVFVVTEY